MTGISVAMATYEGAKHLRAQLDSLAQQTRLPKELHVGDDGSGDDSVEIVRAFATTAPFPVHLHRNGVSLGYGENFIQTALRCSGDWIAFCDQDDVWLPEKLEYCAARIDEGPPDLCLVAHNADIVDANLRPLGRLLYDYPRCALHPRLSLPPEWYCVGFTQIFKRDLLRSVPTESRPSFPWHAHREAHDVWIALLANILGSTLVSGKSLALYRRHDDAVTSSSAQPNHSENLKAKLRSNENGYAERARYLGDVVTLLKQGMPHVEPRLKQMLGTAVDKIGFQSLLLEQRSGVYAGDTQFKRVAAFLALTAAGGYWGHRGWPFGIARMFKDFGYALFPRTGKIQERG